MSKKDREANRLRFSSISKGSGEDSGDRCGRGGLVRAAAVAATVGFVLVASFQVALALGASWGRAAWGGAHSRLPTGLRIASGFAAIFWILAALVVLARAGYEASPVPRGAARWATWALFALLVLGTLMNLASRSRLERLIQTPTAAVLALQTFLVALAG